MHLFMNVFAIFLAKFFDLLLFCPSLYVAIIVYKEKPRFRFILLLCFIIALLDEYFMTIALLSAKRSKDPSTQVGPCWMNIL